MARVFETQTVTVDSYAAPITNVNLDKDFSVLEVAIISSIVKPRGVKEITLGIVYDDAVTLQASLSLETILVGHNIGVVANTALADIQTVLFTEFVESSISDDSMRVTILTISVVGAQVNQYSTSSNQLDPSNPITTGTAITALGTLLESHLVNVGSLQHTTQEPTRGQGTINSILIIVSQA